MEKNYPYPSNITALGIEDYDLFKVRYPDVSVVRYDGRVFPFEDKTQSLLSFRSAYPLSAHSLAAQNSI
ncbi:MAG: hypothetical protein LBE13_19775 [Bacteroidales bacterium]|nr:hypothetical protein [Bacteroidales bacterium]